MYGGAGNDILSGNAGADTAFGGLGDDTYKVSDALDTIVEFENEGHDVVHASADFLLPEHVEELVLFTEGHLTGSGNTANNRLTGNSGNNVLSGDDGDDYINGVVGDDTLLGESGADKLFGGDGNDRLLGGEGADTLSGGAGADILVGGLGNDFMCGDAGSDVFEFSNADGHDVIKSFDVTEDALHFYGVTSSNFIWAEEEGGLRGEYGSGSHVVLLGFTLEDTNEIELSFL